MPTSDQPQADPRLSTRDIRDANVSGVIALLRERGDLTRPELVRASGLSRPTVRAIVGNLISQGLVVESGDVRDSTSRPGRPGAVLSLCSTARMVAAVRLEGSQVEVALGDMAGTIVARRLGPRTPPSLGWTALVRAIGDDILDVHQAHSGLGPLAAVAVTLPGSIDRARGLWTLPRRSGWRDIPVADSLSSALGVPTTLINTTTASLIGHLAHDPTTQESAAMVYIGSSVGCAATSRGHLIDGVTGGPVELGHCVLPGVTMRCWCGRSGCVETVTSARFLQREFRRITGTRAPDSVAEMEAVRDPQVTELITTAAHHLGLAASWLVNIVNPSTLFLGGDPFMAGSSVFFDCFADRLKSSAYRSNLRPISVLPSRPGSTLEGTLQVARELLPQSLQPPLRLAL